MRGYTLHLKILRGGVVAKEAAVRCIWECGRGGFRGVTDPHLSIIGPPPLLSIFVQLGVMENNVKRWLCNKCHCSVLMQIQLKGWSDLW